jgi:hypothetical protein
MAHIMAAIRAVLAVDAGGGDPRMGPPWSPRPCRGTLPHMRPSAPALSRRARAAAGSPVRALLALTGRADVLSLAPGLPAAELLPTDLVAGLVPQVLAPRAAAPRPRSW